MRLQDIRQDLHEKLYDALAKSGIDELRPSQAKAVEAGLLSGRNLLICTPTASGKTLIAEMAMLKAVLEKKKKAIYIVPLVALANEKVKQFRSRYSDFCSIALSVGDFDSADPHLASYDIIVCTAEKLDSLLRHRTPWISAVGTVVTDEVHLLNDPGRGPTLEVLITLLRELLPEVQLVALSATIGNPEMLASWLGAGLVIDSWRPVTLHKGIYFDGSIHFDDG